MNSVYQGSSRNAIIYAEAGKEYVVLSAVMKPMEKPGEKALEK